jgi:hypothetical protein
MTRPCGRIPPPARGRSTAERSEGGRVGVKRFVYSTPTRIAQARSDLPLAGGGTLPHARAICDCRALALKLRSHDPPLTYGKSLREMT